MRWKTKRYLISAVWTTLVTYAITKWAFNYAFIQRGYEAAGSEYLMIPVVCWSAWTIISFLFDSLEGLARERRIREKRIRAKRRAAVK